jgi:polysaccharide biosynthesis/export protein
LAGPYSGQDAAQLAWRSARNRRAWQAAASGDFIRKEWVMRFKGQTTALGAFALLSLALAGCVQTMDNYMPLQHPLTSGCPNCQGPNASVAANGNPAGDNGIVQTSYRSPGGLGDPRPVDSPPEGGYGCPREIQMISHPPYTVAPPDVLLLDVLRAVPKGPYRLEPLESLQIGVTNTLPNQPIAGTFVISPEGFINLGFNYGNLRVGGLSLDEAEAAIRKHLSNILREPNITLSVTQFRGLQQIAGQHLVRPDGTVSLGSYGSVYVAGMTLGQVKCEIERYLAAYLVNPQVSVDMLSYNSKKFYVIFDGAGYGQLVYALPATGNETVLDAISRVGGLVPVSSKHRIFLARPSPCDLGCNQILPVDWQAVLMGSTCTNYQVFPGDRIYVDSNCLIKIDNYLAQFLAPIERILGITLLGTTTVQSFSNNGGSGTGLIVAPR